MKTNSNKAHTPAKTHPWKKHPPAKIKEIKEWAAEATVNPHTNSVRRKSEVYNHKNGIN